MFLTSLTTVFKNSWLLGKNFNNLTTKPSLNRNIWLFYLSSFLSGLIFIIPVWVWFERRMLTVGQMAGLEAVGTALTLVLELPTGAFADLFGRKATAAIGLLLQGIGNVVCGLSIEPVQFTVGFMICSVGSALLSGANDALLFDSLKEMGREDEFAKMSSKNAMSFQAGIVIATLIGGYLAAYSLSLPYMLYGVALLLAAVAFSFKQEPNIDSEVFTLKNYLLQTKAGVMELFRSEKVFELSLFYILVGGITWSSQSFFNQNFAVDLGLTPVEIGWIFSVVRIVNSIVIWKLVHSSWLKPHIAFILFAVLLAVAYLPGYWVGKWVGAAVIALATFGSTARFVILGQYCNHEFRSKNRATAISALNMGVSIFYVAAMVLGGWLMEQFSTKLVISLLGVFTVMTVWPLTFVLVKKYHTAKACGQQTSDT